MLKTEASGSPKGRAVAQVVPGAGGTWLESPMESSEPLSPEPTSLEPEEDGSTGAATTRGSGGGFGGGGGEGSGEGSGEGNGEGSGGAMAKNTGSHCGEQATPRTGSYVFKLRGKATAVRRGPQGACSCLFLEQPRAIK